MSQVTLLDGGMGQELIARSQGAPTPLWSTQVMIDHPGLVADVHRDFTAAGATVATTNTYAILRDRLKDTPYVDQFEDLHALALAEARASGATRLAGAIGPLGASYQPELHPELSVAALLYAEIAALLAPTCDVMLCETVASVLHARAVLDGAATAGRPVWLAFTTKDDDGTLLRSGEPLEEAIAVAQAGAAAVLINCTLPEVIPEGLAILAKSGLPFGAYANGFEKITDGFITDKPTVDALQARADMTPEAYAGHAMTWVDMGATIIGGCCEVGPAHIAEVARGLRASGHNIV